MKIVLQKLIADSGYASRRQAELLIRDGQVKINGQLAFVGDRADPAIDIVSIRGKALSGAVEKIYIKLNKPVGYTCTNRRFKGENNIFDLVNLRERLFAIGRLDKDSHGLILLTNDGALTQELTHPKFQHDKVYEVEIREEVLNGTAISRSLMAGVDIGEGDGLVKAKSSKYLQNNSFIITLSEGKKRQIRRMMAALGLTVSDLKRIDFAGIKLGGLKEGSWAYLNQEEIKSLVG
jgi:pseudouridine synthase